MPRKHFGATLPRQIHPSVRRSWPESDFVWLCCAAATTRCDPQRARFIGCFATETRKKNSVPPRKAHAPAKVLAEREFLSLGALSLKRLDGLGVRERARRRDLEVSCGEQMREFVPMFRVIPQAQPLLPNLWYTDHRVDSNPPIDPIREGQNLDIFGK